MLDYQNSIYMLVSVLFQPTFPTNPRENASDEDLITYYHKNLYKYAEIHAFMILRHNRFMSKTKLRRTIRRLGLRRNNIESSNDEIREGFMNTGFEMLDIELYGECLMCH